VTRVSVAAAEGKPKARKKRAADTDATTAIAAVSAAAPAAAEQPDGGATQSKGHAAGKEQQSGKRKQPDASSPGVPAQATADSGAGSNDQSGGKPRKQKRRKKAPVDESKLSQVELARRHRQKELRDLALKLRARGEVRAVWGRCASSLISATAPAQMFGKRTGQQDCAQPHHVCCRSYC
jgi:hypothetical protein